MRGRGVVCSVVAFAASAVCLLGGVFVLCVCGAVAAICVQRLLADVKIDAFARLQLLLLLNFAHEFMIAGFYCSDW